MLGTPVARWATRRETEKRRALKRARYPGDGVGPTAVFPDLRGLGHETVQDLLFGRATAGVGEHGIFSRLTANIRIGAVGISKA